MKKRLSAITPFILPFMLTAILIWVLQQAESRRETWRKREFEDRLRQEAVQRVELLQVIHPFEEQVRRRGNRMQKILTRLLETRRPEGGPPSSQILGKCFLDAFPKAFAPSFRPRGTKVWLFSIGPDRKPVPIPGPSLQTEKGRIMARIFRSFWDYQNLSNEERSRLGDQCTGTFGDTCPLSFVAPYRKGRVTNCFFEGKTWMLLWNSIRFGNRDIGGFIALFPGKTVFSSRPLWRALNFRPAIPESRGIPVLVPQEDSFRKLEPVFPRISIPPALRKLVIEQSRLPARGEILPHQVLKEFPDAFLYRGLLSVNSSFEVWVAFPKGSPLSGKGHSISGNLGAVLATFWAVVFLRILWTGNPIHLPMKVWLPGFFALVGGLPLTAFYLVGSMQIEITLRREILSLRENAIAQLEGIDSGNSAQFTNFGTTCRKVISSPPWFAGVLGRKPEFGLKAARIAHDSFRSAGIPLETVLFIPFGESSRVFCFGSRLSKGQASGVVDLYESTIIPVLQPLFFLDPTRFENTPTDAKMVGQWLQKTGVFGDNGIFKRDYILVGMGKGAVSTTAGKSVLHYFDFLSPKSVPDQFVAFIADPAAGYILRLRRVIRKYNGSVGDPRRWIALGVRTGEGMEPDRPRLSGKFWGTGFGRKLRRDMEIAEQLDSRRVSETESSVFVAYPCRQAPGLILGTHVPLDIPRQNAQTGKMMLDTLTGGIGLFIFLIASFVSRNLVSPLKRIEEGLLEVASGDLGVRVAVAREDELGEMTRSLDLMIRGLENRRDLGRFVSGTLDAAVAQVSEEEIWAPVKRPGAVLVSDLRDFTSHSESHPPEEIVTMLNHHLESMADCIQRGGGMIEKFIGDAVVASFYDLDGRSGLAAALEAACAMRRRHQGIQEERRVRGLFPYEMGVGIDEGTLLAGTIVSSGRLEHAVLGLPRKEAENLESLSRKGKSTKIVLSPAASRRAREHFPQIAFRELDFRRGFELENLLPTGEGAGIE